MSKRKWSVTLPTGQGFTLDSDDPGRELLAMGHNAFTLSEIIPPPVVPIREVKPLDDIQELAVSASRAAKLLGVSRPVIYDLTHQADFPAFKIGQRTLISVEGLRAWIQKQIEGGAVVC